MKILWLEFAEEDLDSIYRFYAEKNSGNFASRLYNQILNAAENLTHSPQMGPIGMGFIRQGRRISFIIGQKIL